MAAHPRSIALSRAHMTQIAFNSGQELCIPERHPHDGAVRSIASTKYAFVQELRPMFHSVSLTFSAHIGPVPRTVRPSANESAIPSNQHAGGTQPSIARPRLTSYISLFFTVIALCFHPTRPPRNWKHVEGHSHAPDMQRVTAREVLPDKTTLVRIKQMISGTVPITSKNKSDVMYDALVVYRSKAYRLDMPLHSAAIYYAFIQS